MSPGDEVGRLPGAQRALEKPQVAGNLRSLRRLVATTQLNSGM